MQDRWEGRSRINSLNVVPLRLIYERWVSGYADLWASKLTSLKRSLEEDPRVLPQGLAKIRLGVVVVVQVDLHLHEPARTQAGQLIHMLRLVLIDGIEERMPRRAPVAVAEALEPPRILQHPVVHP